jgi:Uma2 family endonuclease
MVIGGSIGVSSAGGGVVESWSVPEGGVMNMVFSPPALDPDDFERTSDGGLYEFVDGVPVEKPMGAESDLIGMNLAIKLAPFCGPGKVGLLFGAQTGYRCFPHEPKRVRKPDVSVVRTDRLPDGKVPKGDFRIRPDLAVEVLSPNDLCDALELKLADYRAAGIPLVWVLSPATRTAPAASSNRPTPCPARASSPASPARWRTCSNPSRDRRAAPGPTRGRVLESPTVPEGGVMNMVFSPPAVTPDDLLRMPDGDRYELIDGRLREKRMGARSDEITVAVGTALRVHAYPARLGRVYAQTGFACFPGHPGRVRKPDVAFVARHRLTDDRSPDGYFLIRPDLAAEVVSPNDLFEEVADKLADYARAGIPLVWVVSPAARTVTVWRADGTGYVLDESGTLAAEGVLPGFSCPVADLFA